MTSGPWLWDGRRRDYPVAPIIVQILEVGSRAASWFDGCQWCLVPYGSAHRVGCHRLAREDKVTL